MSITHPPQPVSAAEGPLDPTHLWETAVALASIKARAALPHSNGRVDKAMALVLGGAVELLADHTARVTSQQDGATQYYVVNGSCQCRDFPNAPQGACKHRISRWILLRAVQIAKEVGDTPAPTAASPQPPIPSEFIVTISGKPFILYHGLLHMAHQQGLLSLHAEFTTVTDTYALAKATVHMHDGRVFSECGDSTPENVGAKVKPSWRRMALVRAKARALRDALDVAYTCAEELE